MIWKTTTFPYKLRQIKLIYLTFFPAYFCQWKYLSKPIQCMHVAFQSLGCKYISSDYFSFSNLYQGVCLWLYQGIGLCIKRLVSDCVRGLVFHCIGRLFFDCIRKMVLTVSTYQEVGLSLYQGVGLSLHQGVGFWLYQGVGLCIKGLVFECIRGLVFVITGWSFPVLGGWSLYQGAGLWLYQGDGLCYQGVGLFLYQGAGLWLCQQVSRLERVNPKAVPFPLTLESVFLGKSCRTKSRRFWRLMMSVFMCEVLPLTIPRRAGTE